MISDTHASFYCMVVCKKMTTEEALTNAIEQSKILNDLLSNKEEKLTHRQEWLIKQKMKRHQNLIETVQTLRDVGLDFRWINSQGVISFKFSNLYGGFDVCEYRPASGKWQVIKGQKKSVKYNSSSFAFVMNRLFKIKENNDDDNLKI